MPQGKEDVKYRGMDNGFIRIISYPSRPQFTMNVIASCFKEKRSVIFCNNSSNNFSLKHDTAT